MGPASQELGPHQALRDDVRWLGTLLGDTLREQVGEQLFDRVEGVRRLARAARAEATPDYRPVAAVLRTFSLEEMLDVARAFSVFLSLANIAEQHHRVRRRRDYQRREESKPQGGSFPHAFQRLLDEGVAPDDLVNAVADLQVELVLTAHPTQVVRRTVLQKHDRIAAALATRDRDDLTVREREATEAEVRAAIAEIWETDAVRRERPTPLEEARAGMVVFERTLWDAIPAVHRAMDAAFDDVVGQAPDAPYAPVRFGSWMGGDRDGNPFVTPQVTREAILLGRWMAAYLYEREIDQLRDELSLRTATDEMVALAGAPYEPYRVALKRVRNGFRDVLRDVEARLEGRRPPAGLEPWTDVSGLAELLSACDRSLRATGNERLANGRLLDVRRRVATFGLQMIRLDIRQESGRHTAALDAITRHLDLGSYAEWDEPTRIAFLEAELDSKRPLIPTDLPCDERVRDTLDTFAVIAELGPDPLGAYVISMARAASDVLAVRLLQKASGVAEPLRVVPLFETEADLKNAPAALTSLFGTAAYREAIGDRQEVMIGYSDSAKDAGRLASAWRLFCAQEEIVRVCRAHGVRPTLFHGRGGTVGRGGGPTWLAIRSQPPGSIGGSLRVTEQGEVIDHHFGIPGIAERTLEVYLTATLEASIGKHRAPNPAWRVLMEQLSDRSAAAYRDVVRGDARFVDYFRKATPEVELSNLNIGSRPARRAGGKGGVDSLRAIPWVFAWTQTRLLLPSWLGVGTALNEAIEAGSGDALRAMYRDWPFFRSTIDLVQMVLAKAEPSIAEFYDAVLVPDELRTLGDELRAALAATRDALLAVTGERGLLADNAVLRRSISVRNPYVDPINLIQVELLRRVREAPSDEVMAALLVTVNGIAAGMRNTG